MTINLTSSLRVKIFGILRCRLLDVTLNLNSRNTLILPSVIVFLTVIYRCVKCFSADKEKTGGEQFNEEEDVGHAWSNRPSCMVMI